MGWVGCVWVVGVCPAPPKPPAAKACPLAAHCPPKPPAAREREARANGQRGGGTNKGAGAGRGFLRGRCGQALPHHLYKNNICNKRSLGPQMGIWNKSK